ncbi:hypothetical protein ANANG_G00099250 [Anguilla anguilla]|uniref:Uncharacterized protein n=1 Tax=Anguilla anguilla TaxID=7936 RepID=A0A9D3MJN2_ANGAN|nr:hypothetical protein ANANG_G00099250 [Anguilla anguilla]
MNLVLGDPAELPGHWNLSPALWTYLNSLRSKKKSSRHKTAQEALNDGEDGCMASPLRHVGRCRTTPPWTSSSSLSSLRCLRHWGSVA